MQEPNWEKLPILLSPQEARRILGKLPRDLENMVMVQAAGKPERKLFRKKEVRARWMAR